MAKQLYIDFDEYTRQGEPEAAISAEQWKIAMGLQAVDGMKPSQYLVDVARRNIEGDITMDEVQELLHSYYASATNRDKIEENEEEADKASANIKRILSTNTLAFNTNGYIATHRRIFEGVFKHAGQLRQYDISKKEWVLHGDTVNYLNWEDLRRALDYDIQQEKDFSYKGLSDDEKIKHICRFTSGLWQIHPFCEGNTRATAVFLIQYLRSIGYTVTNDMFAEHSWYFRNALVRANYKNLAQGIDYELVYLERFLRNMLLGEQWVLKNRYLIINPPEEFKEQPRLDEVQQIEKLGKNTDVLLKKLGRKAEKFGIKLGKNKIAILRLVMTNPFVSTTQMAKELSITTTAIDNNIKQMRDILLRHVGPKKGGHWEICEQED